MDNYYTMYSIHFRQWMNQKKNLSVHDLRFQEKKIIQENFLTIFMCTRERERERERERDFVLFVHLELSRLSPRILSSAELSATKWIDQIQLQAKANPFLGVKRPFLLCSENWSPTFLCSLSGIAPAPKDSVLLSTKLTLPICFETTYGWSRN